MKIFKKVIPVILALVMVLAMGSTAFAADGSIKVNGTTDGKTYDAYKVFDLTYAGTSAAYTIDPDWTAFFEGAGAKYIVDTNPGTLNPITIGAAQKYINITDANVAAFAQDALTYAAKKAADKTETASGTTVNFTGLELGYYLVYPQGATDIAAGNGSLCSLTSTMPAAEVNVKATYPSIKKEVNDDTVDIGQTVTYTVSGKVPDTTGYDAYEYTVKDTLSAGLTFNKAIANMTIKIDGAVIPLAIDPVYSNNGFTFTLDMCNYETQVGKDIVITYSAVVNANAVIGAAGNANAATLEYSNDPADDTKTTITPPVVVKVYTATIKINKFEKDKPGTKLAGAKFVLKDDAGKFYKFTAASGDTPESVQWVDAQADATVVTTTTEGTAFFNGIESGAYQLVETEAPSGYNKLANPFPITISHTEQTNVASLFQTADVANSTGSVLPSTGGIGTTIFYIVGGLLMCGAIVMLITRKKMSGREN